MEKKHQAFPDTKGFTGEEIEILDNLIKFAIQIKTHRYRHLAVRLMTLSLDPNYTTQDTLDSLIRDVEIAINKEVIKEYENKFGNIGKKLKQR